MLSVIIPSYNDPFLQNTIDSLLTAAEGEIEIIAVLDGYTPQKAVRPHKRVNIVHLEKNKGMRAAINVGLLLSGGKYIMKCDSHCLFAPGFDKVLIENCEENWLLVPRRYSLDETKWERDIKRPYRDYHYLTFPSYVKGYGVCLSPQDWLKRGGERSGSEYDIDDTMTFQGSCWFAHKEYFMKHVGFLNDNHDAYGPFGGEQIEIGLKYWLGGGQNKVIKKTWYAHLSKQPRHYKAGIFTRNYKNKQSYGRSWAASHWMNNNEPNMKHKISWLVEKFWPVPGWPDDRSLWVLK